MVKPKLSDVGQHSWKLLSRANALTSLPLVVFWEFTYICVQEHPCHPSREALALLEYTNQCLKTSGWPAGLLLCSTWESTRQNLGTAVLPVLGGPVVPVMFIVLALKENAETSSHQDHLENVPIHVVAMLHGTLCPGFMSELPWCVPGAEGLPESHKSSYQLSHF